MTVADPEAFAEDELVPISAIQHMLYCPRQCALIQSPPARGRGLKPVRAASVSEPSEVAPGVGAWIETRLSVSC